MTSPVTSPALDCLRRDLDQVAALMQRVPDLVGLAQDLAAWSEGIDVDCCDCLTLAEIEQLGQRAHAIVWSLRGDSPDGAGKGDPA